MSYRALLQDVLDLTEQALQLLERDEIEQMAAVLEKRQAAIDRLAGLDVRPGGLLDREQLAGAILEVDRRLVQQAEQKLLVLRQQWQSCRQMRRALDTYRQPSLQPRGMFLEEKQ